MALELATLPVAEIRRRCLTGEEPLTPRLLRHLQSDPRQGVRALHATLRRRMARERSEYQRLDAMLNFERVLWRSGVTRVAGVDEAGVGPLAGPVVAAAVVFPPETRLAGVDDSKRLDPARREELAGAIRENAAGVGVGVAEVGEIDELNIHHAGLLAMRRAVEALPEPPEHVLVDARTIPGLEVPQNPFQKGDGIDFSIAAASIVAKTHRDALMDRLDAEHPGYGFARHKGYPTPQHQDAVRRLGPSPVHRRSFTAIREICGEYSPEFYALKRQVGAARSAAEAAAAQERLEERRGLLADGEQRKLRILLARRWKAL